MFKEEKEWLNRIVSEIHIDFDYSIFQNMLTFSLLWREKWNIFWEKNISVDLDSGEDGHELSERFLRGFQKRRSWGNKISHWEKEVNVEIDDGMGRTPLIYASLYGQVDVVKFLIDNTSANIEVKSISS